MLTNLCMAIVTMVLLFFSMSAIFILLYTPIAIVVMIIYVLVQYVKSKIKEK